MFVCAIDSGQLYSTSSSPVPSHLPPKLGSQSSHLPEHCRTMPTITLVIGCGSTRASRNTASGCSDPSALQLRLPSVRKRCSELAPRVLHGRLVPRGLLL